MTRKSCAVGMRNAILRNYLKSKFISIIGKTVSQLEVPFWVARSTTLRVVGHCFHQIIKTSRFVLYKTKKNVLFAFIFYILFALLQCDQEKREICKKFRKMSKWQICMQILSIYDSLKTRKDCLSVRFTVTVKNRKHSIYDFLRCA